MVEQTPSRREQVEASKLSDYAMQLRRTMLAVAIATVGISVGGLRPSEITALGIKVSQVQETYLIAMMSLVLAYLVGNFWVVAAHEALNWNAAIHEFGREADIVVRNATNQIKAASDAVTKAAEASPETVARDVADAIENLTRTIERNSLYYLLKKQKRMYSARLFYEYSLPIWIALGVAYVALGRLVIAAIEASVW